MVDRRDALKIAGGAALASQFPVVLGANGRNESKQGVDIDVDQETTTTPAGEELSGIFLAAATGGEQVPPVASEGRGSATFTLNDDGDAIEYVVAVQDIQNVNQAHIHRGNVGANGPIVAWLYPEGGQEPDLIEGEFDGVLAAGTIEKDDLVGPFDDGTLTVLLQAMQAGEAYLNVHTEQNPAGEVRGQIVSVAEMAEALGFAQEVTTTEETPEEEETTPAEEEETTTTEEETTPAEEETTPAEEETTPAEEETTPAEEETTTTTPAGEETTVVEETTTTAEETTTT